MSIRSIIAYMTSFAGLILTNYGLYKALEIGNCGVDQFSDISRLQSTTSMPCMHGTGTAIMSTTFGLALVSFGIILFVLSFKKMNIGWMRQGILLATVTWSLLFITMAITFLVVLGGSISFGLAVTFAVVGLTPLLFLPLLYRRYDTGFNEPRNFPQRSTVTSSVPTSPTISTVVPPVKAPGTDSGTIKKIAELTELHQKGILTDLEFEQQKQKLLGRL